jgi:2-methylisocitrate lyase-like PEP mutase family enzyme
VGQIEKAKEFAALHVKGRPVLLYNAWDAGSAKAIVRAGAKAVATKQTRASRRYFSPSPGPDLCNAFP